MLIFHHWTELIKMYKPVRGSNTFVVGSCRKFRQWNGTPQLLNMLRHHTRPELSRDQLQLDLARLAVRPLTDPGQQSVRRLTTVHRPSHGEVLVVVLEPQLSCPDVGILLRGPGTSVIQAVVVVQHAAKQRLCVLFCRHASHEGSTTLHRAGVCTLFLEAKIHGPFQRF